jgi:hypothetical protein
MADEQVTKVGGLEISPNTLSVTNSGSLKQALNCVVNFAGVIESRRGFKYVPYSFGNTDSRGNALLSFRGTLLVQYDSDKLAHDTGVSFADYAGSYAPPSGQRTRAQEANQNLYFTSAAGVKVLDDAANEPKDAGLPRGPLPGGRASRTCLTGAPGTGWTTPNTGFDYITIVGLRDANDNVKLGEASPRYHVGTPAELTMPAGSVVGHTTYIQVTCTDRHGFRVGDPIFVTLSGADPAGFGFVTETATVTYASELVFRFAGISTYTNVNDVIITAAGLNVSVTYDLPPDLTTSHFVQVCRTKAVSGRYNVPSQDYYIVDERTLTSADITAGYVTFIDDTPESLLRSPYYNNVNVGGEAPDGSPDNENARPPLCLDLAAWDDRLWGACLTNRHSLTVTLLGVNVASDTALRSGDHVLVGGVTFVAYSSETLPSAPVTINGVTYQPNQFFQCWDGTLDSFMDYDLGATDRIERTAQSLAMAITQHPSCTVNAYYVAKAGDFPGSIFLETRSPAGAAFTFDCTRTGSSGTPTDAFDVALPATSTAPRGTNEVWFSKQEQSEAVPRLNRLSIGPKNTSISRIRALRERLFVFTDRGIYTVSNTYPYRVDLLSKTATLYGADTLVDFDDALYALTSQGFAKISPGGVGVLGLPIESELKKMYGVALPALKSLSVAVGYESCRKFIVSLPSAPSDTVNTHQYVFDVSTRAWTEWDRPIATMAVVPETDLLYTVSTTENRVSVERKLYTRSDYVDESFTVSLLAASGGTLTLTSTSGITAGDAIYQSEIQWGLVTAVVDATTVTTDTTSGWSVGLSTECYRAIDNQLMFNEVFSKRPNYTKHVPAVTFHFRTPGISTGTAVFSSEEGPSDAETDLDLTGWGTGQWGRFAWGQPGGTKNIRVYTTDNATRSSYLNVGLRVREAFGVWSLLGYTVEQEVMSERNSQ